MAPRQCFLNNYGDRSAALEKDPVTGPDQRDSLVGGNISHIDFIFSLFLTPDLYKQPEPIIQSREIIVGVKH